MKKKNILDNFVIEKVHRSKIKPAKYNPRKLSDDAKKRLEYSLKSWGLVETLVWNKKTGNLVSGHQRLNAIDKELGLDYEIQVSVVDLPLDKEFLLNVALNNPKMHGEYDFPLLKDGFAEFDTGDVDVEMSGFTEEELKEFWDYEAEPEEKDDEVPEVDEKKVITNLGDLYKLGEHRLLCGDATKKEDIERLMGSKKADMVFTDPPYDLEDQYSKNALTACKIDCHVFIMNTSKKLVENINNNIKYFRRIFAIDFRIPHLVSNHQPMDRVDLIAEFNQGKGKFNNIKDGFSTLIECAKIHSTKGETEHKQEKKVKLPELFIKHYSRRDELVVDLFMGSGTTLIACEKNNRICYGSEIDPHYCDIIIKRWENFTGKKAKKNG